MASQLNQAEWNKFVLASPHATFLHAWEWGQLQERLGVRHWRLTVDTGGSVHAVTLVVKRALPLGKSWLYLPRGPVFAAGLSHQEQLSAWQSLDEQLRAIAEAERALFARLDPPWPVTQAGELTSRGWVKAEREVQPKDTLVIDLTKSEDELLAGMHQKTRYNIRLAQKQEIAIAFSDATGALEEFLTLAHDVQARSGFHYHPAAYYRAMREALGSQFEVATATHAEGSLAAHILTSFGQITTYAHGASRSQHRQLMAPHLLQWESMRRAKQAGSTRYDFFGIAPADAAPTHSWQGITRFKLGFGGIRESYVGAYDFVFDSLGYAGFTMAKRLRKLWR